jgi:hypothetical protein
MNDYQVKALNGSWNRLEDVATKLLQTEQHAIGVELSRIGAVVRGVQFDDKPKPVILP